MDTDATSLSDDPADTAGIGLTVALAAWSAGRLVVALEHAARRSAAAVGASQPIRIAVELFSRPGWYSPGIL